jgi:hypothetical protein
MRCFEVLMGFESPLYCYTVMVMVRAEVDWLAVMEAEVKVRRVFELLPTVPVEMVRVRAVIEEEAWLAVVSGTPMWARMLKAEVAALETGFTGFQD